MGKRVSGYWFYIGVALLLSSYAWAEPSGIPPFDPELERERKASAALNPIPVIESLWQDGKLLWTRGQNTAPTLKADSWVTLRGTGFGYGPGIDHSKIMVGKVRAMERRLDFFNGKVNRIKRTYNEKRSVRETWDSDIESWTDDEIVFRIPRITNEGPIVVAVQHRLYPMMSLRDPGAPHTVWDPLSERVKGRFKHMSDTISMLGPIKESNPIAVKIENKEYKESLARGEAAFWAFDYNIGLAHAMSGLDWEKIFRKETIDPMTNKIADPEELFGAVPIYKNQAPAVASQKHYFDPFPMPMPVKPLIGRADLKGYTYPSGYAGYVYAENKNPINMKREAWIGMNCAACHARTITYENEAGKEITRFFMGIPNPKWTMKWLLLGHMHGIKTKEVGPDGVEAEVDKSQLIYAMPDSATEATIVRDAEIDTKFVNDYFFSPTATPLITRHTPVRRALSQTDMVAGFEGSYMHAIEPDGSLGLMRADALRDLTVYMASLDRDNETLEYIGLYRWLKRKGMLDEIDNVSQGEFLRRKKKAFPKLSSAIQRGEAVYKRDCRSCHQSNFGTHSDENMFPLNEVGTYFSPSIFHRQTQSIRTAIMGQLYWLETRGLLHDGHVKSLEDLVDPDRCNPESQLYAKYYTMHPGSFKVPKGTPEQELFTRRHRYFVDVPWDDDHLYWDYQKMRREFGPAEVGSRVPTPLPHAPHPWCTQSKQDIDDLVHYLLTL